MRSRAMAGWSCGVLMRDTGCRAGVLVAALVIFLVRRFRVRQPCSSVSRVAALVILMPPTLLGVSPGHAFFLRVPLLESTAAAPRVFSLFLMWPPDKRSQSWPCRLPLCWPLPMQLHHRHRLPPYIQHLRSTSAEVMIVDRVDALRSGRVRRTNLCSAPAAPAVGAHRGRARGLLVGANGRRRGGAAGPPSPSVAVGAPPSR